VNRSRLKQPRMKSLLEKLGYFETTRPSIHFTDNWSDEEFIRQMKELIGNEGDIHVTCNHSEESEPETHVHAAGVNVSPEGRSWKVLAYLNAAKTEVLNQRYFLGPYFHSEVNYGFESIR
ncbi:hypothetical protein ACVXHA_03040, partial [Escherichia coli]